MTTPVPVLYAPQTDAPILGTDPVVVEGRRMSADTALRRYSREQIEAAGYRFPGPADAHRLAVRAIQARAQELQGVASDNYGWPEGTTWRELEGQARAYLADANDIGPDLYARGGYDPARVAAVAPRIVERADQFRAALSIILPWRDDAVEALDAALAHGADVAGIEAARDAQLAIMAEGLPA